MFINLKTARALGITIPSAVVRSCRRDFRVIIFCVCSQPLMAPHVVSLRRDSLDALRGEADIQGALSGLASSASLGFAGLTL
jgi:hypothetical protein